jgi:hypothetical protein
LKRSAVFVAEMAPLSAETAVKKGDETAPSSYQNGYF